MSKKFKKVVEDFICEHCGASVTGNGFTNHCPECLYSKHVDVFPGDREAACGGMMKLVKVEKEKNVYVLTHKCIKCGYEKRNKMDDQDDFDVVLQSVKRNSSLEA